MGGLGSGWGWGCVGSVLISSVCAYARFAAMEGPSTGGRRKSRRNSTLSAIVDNVQVWHWQRTLSCLCFVRSCFVGFGFVVVLSCLVLSCGCLVAILWLSWGGLTPSSVYHWSSLFSSFAIYCLVLWLSCLMVIMWWSSGCFALWLSSCLMAVLSRAGCLVFLGVVLCCGCLV
jgi:hypothetical protein